MPDNGKFFESISRVNPEKSNEIKDEIEFCEQLGKSSLVAEGNNGIIFRVDTSNQVTKLLKVFNYQNLEEEYTKQIRANEIIRDLQDSVVVPKIGEKSIIHIDTDEKLQMLNNNTRIFKMNLKMGSELAVFEMEYFEGMDIARHLCELVCKHRPDLFDIDPSTLGFNELHGMIGNSLGFEYPKQQRDQAVFEAGRTKLNAKNRLKLYEYAHKFCGFYIDPEELSKLENTISCWHKNGFFHRDLHDRNILINDGGELCIIDFGSAIEFSGHIPPRSDIYTVSSEDGVYYDDTNILTMLAKFSKKYKKEDQGMEISRERKEKIDGFIKKKIAKIERSFPEVLNSFKDEARQFSINADQNSSYRTILNKAMLFCHDINVASSSKQAEFMALAIVTFCVEANIDIENIVTILDTSNPIELQLHNQLLVLI